MCLSGKAMSSPDVRCKQEVSHQDVGQCQGLYWKEGQGGMRYWTLNSDFHLVSQTENDTD